MCEGEGLDCNTLPQHVEHSRKSSSRLAVCVYVLAHACASERRDEI